MIENLFELGHKPGILASRQLKDEYKTRLDYHNAINFLNAALSPRAQEINAMDVGGLVELRHQKINKYYNPPPGSWREEVTVTAICDIHNDVIIVGERKFDNIKNYLSLSHEIVQLVIDSKGTLMQVDYGKFNKTMDYESDVWSNPKFRAQPKQVFEKKEQTETIQFLAKLLTS